MGHYLEFWFAGKLVDLAIGAALMAIGGAVIWGISLYERWRYFGPGRRPGRRP